MSFSDDLAPWGAAVLRVSLGVVMLAHSVWLKGVVFGLAGTAAFFVELGLPGALAYAVFAVETVAGVALLLGYRTRLAALAVLPVLAGATWAHAEAGWLFTNAGGGWEYPAYLLVTATVVAMLGDGAAAWSGRARRAPSPVAVHGDAS